MEILIQTVSLVNQADSVLAFVCLTVCLMLHLQWTIFQSYQYDTVKTLFIREDFIFA